jgi:ribosomal protein S12 methylthiotransferase accessory factor
MIDLARAREMVSPRVGIIRSLIRVPTDADDPSGLIFYLALLSHFDFRAASPAERSASGRGATDDEATLGAIAEAVERYCAAQIDPRQLLRAPWDDVRDQAIAPTEFVLYSARQYAAGTAPAIAWAPSAPLTWARGRELPSGREVLVPAGLVYLGTVSQDPRDALCQMTSSGLAAGDSFEMATLHGLMELVERDALMVTWMNRLPAPEIDLAEVDGAVAAIRQRHERRGVTIRAFDITTDLGIPVVLAVALDDTGAGPSSIVALGCDLDPAAAARKAVAELCQVRAGALNRARGGAAPVPPTSAEQVRSLDDHGSYLSHPARRGEFAFLLDHGRRADLADRPTRRTGDVSSDLDICVSRLTEHGYRVAAVDVTTSDVAPYGFRVVRAFAAGLQPIHFGWGYERLGGRRLFEVPRAMGYDTQVRRESDLNPCPHPLA